MVCSRNILWDWALVDTRKAGENIDNALKLPVEVRDGRVLSERTGGAKVGKGIWFLWAIPDS